MVLRLIARRQPRAASNKMFFEDRTMQLANPVLLTSSLVIIVFVALSQWFWGPSTQAPPAVTASEIRAFQDDENGQDNFVIVDVRSKAETDVSMIPGALTISEFEETAAQHQGKHIIVYCTIEVRSAQYATALIQNGWEASNYKGSILDWCGNNLPLVTSGQSTNRVHTYNQWYSAPNNYVSVN